MGMDGRWWLYGSPRLRSSSHRLRAVKWNKVEWFHHNVGIFCHRVAEMIIASVCQVTQDIVLMI